MAKALVAYYSCSGNTEKMAGVIAAGLKDEQIDTDMKDVEKVAAADLINYDIIIIGSPTYYGSPAYQIKKLLDESVKLHGKLDGKIGAAFSSAANIAGGNETTILDILHAFLIHGMIVQGDPRGDHYGPVGIGDPDTRTIEECRRLAKRVARLAEKLLSS